MSDELSIQPGDIVTVHFEGRMLGLRGEVVYVPSAPGDCWHIKTNDGLLYYVQSFEYIVKDAQK